MAHLTIRLGAPVVVPFRIPRGWRGHRRARAWNARLRWQALCEAALVAVDRNQIGRSMSFHSIGHSRRHRAPGSAEDVWS
jgi:hypothetical protein